MFGNIRAICSPSCSPQRDLVSEGPMSSKVEALFQNSESSMSADGAGLYFCKRKNSASCSIRRTRQKKSSFKNVGGACVQQQDMSGSDIGADHKQYSLRRGNHERFRHKQ